MSIGAVPAEEECAQVGKEGYSERARAECAVYVRQLRRQMGDEPPGARLVVKGCSHDFGTYYEVHVAFDDQDEEAREYAYKVENNSPSSWDAIARQELNLAAVVG